MLLHLLLMFEYKINICHGNKDALFPKTVARLSCNIHAVWFCTVYNNLQASGINKLLDILKAADVSTCADFDLDIAVDIFDGMDILLVFFVIVWEIKKDDFIDTAVIIKTCQTDPCLLLPVHFLSKWWQQYFCVPYLKTLHSCIFLTSHTRFSFVIYT